MRWLSGLLFAAATLLAAVAQAAPSLDDYGRLPAIELVEISPAGDRLAYVGVHQEARKLVVQTVDGKPLLVWNIGEAKVRGIDWAGENHVLVSISETVRIFPGAPKQEFGQVLRVNLAAKEIALVFEKSRRVFAAVLGFAGTAKVDGRWYGYFGGAELKRGMGEDYLGDGYPDLYRVDLVTGEADQVAKGGESLRRWVVNAAGRVVAHSRYDEASGRWGLYRGDTNTEMIGRRLLPFASSALLGLGRTPDAIAINEEDEGGVVVGEMPLAGGEMQPLFGDQPVHELLHDSTTGLLIGAQFDRNLGAKLFDPIQQRKFDAARKAFPQVEATVVSFSADMQRIVVFTSGKEDSGTYWLVDIDTRRARVIGDIYPAVKAADVGPPSMISYRAADGLEIEGALTLPPGKPAKQLPLVVLPHGGPIVDGDRPVFDWWAQAFASRGYAVLQPNYRGTTGYGAAFRQAAVGQWGRKMQTDLSDGVAVLAAAGTIDPKRVCIVGGSYGGYAALAGVTVQQGLYRCAVSVAGIGDMRRMITWARSQTQSDNRATRLWRVLTLDPDGGRDPDAISPAALAERADAPILLIHGKDDTVVPLEQSQAMASALKRAGKPHELIVMDGEDHWLSREATRVTMLKSAVAFVEKHNPPS